MSQLDISIAELDAGHVRLRNAHHYEVPAQDVCALYIPATTDIELSVGGRAFEHVACGGLICVPNGKAHVVRLPGAPRQARVTLNPPFATANRRAGDSDAMVFVARHAASANPIPDLVPNRFVITPDQVADHPRLNTLISAVRNLADDDPNAATDAVFLKLAEALALLLIEGVIARRSETNNARVGGAFQDARLRNALRVMHERPAEDWTLERLAREVGFSRSVFAETFRKSTGQTPYQYLTRLRIDAASRLLRQPQPSISEVAWQSGYQSDAAFIKAFRRVVGVSPGAYRREKLHGG